jgi:hypothetical protein
MKRKYIIGIVLFFVACFAVGLYWRLHIVKAPDNNIVPNIPVATTTPSTKATTTSSSGAVVINDQYQLFVQTLIDKDNNYLPETKYFDDGVISSGKYAGYHRLIAFLSANDPSGGHSLTFVTTDYKKFILDDFNTADYLVSDYGRVDGLFNQEKVIAKDAVPSNFPKTINSGNFVLVRNDISWDNAVGKWKELPSLEPGLKFYEVPVVNPTNDLSENHPEGYGDFKSAKNKYLAATTQLAVVDAAGLVYNYQLVTSQSFRRAGGIPGGQYNFQNFYEKSDVISDTGLYSSYGQMFPGGCGATGSSYVLKNISDADLNLIGNAGSGQEIYILKNSNHDIYKAAYYSKFVVFEGYFSEMNNGKELPGISDYVAKNPVLIVKDNWGRWLGLGELEYQIPGGCGKPVIYLYPEKPTEVLVKFLAPINFTVSIPNYAGQWRVLANPNGQLKDLQAEKTNCSNINFNFVGSEYAKDSCASATYPYLYWSGQVSGNYSQPTEGWVVGRGELEKFLNEKLNILGLSTKEKNDMVSYWLPQMLKKDTAYYRLAFLQTAEVNKLFPMLVTPKPDTTFRIFLDWQPLVSELVNQLSPQELTPLVRKGFTLVEWGGLKQ